METYEIIKGKDICYNSMRKALAKLASALNKVRYINKGAYGTLYYKSDNDGSYKFAKNKRTYNDYDYEFSGKRYNIEVNFDKNKMTLYTNLKISKDDRNNPEFLQNEWWVEDTLKKIKLAVKEMEKIHPEKASMEIVCTISRSFN